MCLGRCMCWRNDGGKKVICKKLNLSALSGILGHFKSEFGKKKVSGNFFRLRGAVGCRKVKKKKKNFYKTFSLPVFLFPVIKRGEKVSGLFFFRKGRGKM